MEKIFERYRMNGDDYEFSTLLFNYVTEHPEYKCGSVVRDESGKIIESRIDREKYEKLCDKALENHPDRNRFLAKYSYDEFEKYKCERIVAFVSKNC